MSNKNNTLNDNRKVDPIEEALHSVQEEEEGNKATRTKLNTTPSSFQEKNSLSFLSDTRTYVSTKIHGLMYETKHFWVYVSLALAVCSSPPGLYLLHWLLVFLRTVLGWSVGIGLGLGFASHVYEQLEYDHPSSFEKQKRRHYEQQQQFDGNIPLIPPSRPFPTTRSASTTSLRGGGQSFRRRSSSLQQQQPAVLQDEQTYASLMASAGYLTIRHAEQGLPLHYLRGQHLSNSEQHQEPRYRFTEGNVAIQCLQTLFPALPSCIQTSIGKAMELILRDYVACWYCMVDPGCVYKDPQPKEGDEPKAETEQETPSPSHHRLLESLAIHRPLPFLESLYTTMGTMLGNLATRCQHNVNVFHLLLVQYPRILALTFQAYRQARATTMDNNNNEQDHELAMAKEFFLLHKYHRAITFGMDVPSVLFNNNSNTTLTMEQLLRMVSDNEVDYHRVVAHRMVRALLGQSSSRSSESSSAHSIVTTLLTEVMGSCVLTPIVQMMGPDYINAWIIMGLASTTETTTDGDNDENENNNEKDEKEGDTHEQTTTDDEIAANEEKEGEVHDEENIFEPSSLREDMVEDTKAESTATTLVESLTHILAMTLMELQNYIDFEECRDQATIAMIDWEDDGCRAAVLKLVLIIEAALSHGRCCVQQQPLDTNVDAVEVTLPEYETSVSLTELFMEMTSDVDGFVQNSTAISNHDDDDDDNARLKSEEEEEERPDYIPTATDQSTLRTLIAAWLHAGHVHRAVSIVGQAPVFAPYYHKTAFCRTETAIQGFVRQLRVLNDVPMVVDTMSVLTSPRLEELEDNNNGLLVARNKTTATTAVAQPKAPLLSSTQFLSSSALPRHLDFHRNASFAASLRSERDRRRQSWERILQDDVTHVDSTLLVHRVKGGTEHDTSVHKELHHLARVFYAGTQMLAMRNAARRTTEDKSTTDNDSSVNVSPDVQVSLLTVETASSRRRFEVPDDDSSFLLRAQPRPLNAVGVHRDQRNHDQSFKCFSGTYETPALPAASEHYTGGRYIRRCLIRYFPIDRTASVALQNDARKLDQRKSQSQVPETITLGQSTPRPFLSAEFLKERHLCQRWVPKGTTRSQSLLASNVMEPTDFTATPRTGKALDFVYRMNFFERPMLDLGGKHFTVYDSSSLGTHRADASALELSDASLSAALLTLGLDDEDCNSVFEMGEDGYPVVWMKLNRKQDDSHVEVKPYRTSFIRAALMVTATRQEAQLRCLVKCVKAGSAKKATKALTDLYLRPTLKILEFAGSRSRAREGALLRDLKLGVAHLDREQLRRNALLSPRYPTQVLGLSATIEEAAQGTDPKIADIFGSSVAVFKIKCSAKVSFVALEDDFPGHESYRGEGNAFPSAFEENWVVYRTLKDFQNLHKHLKTQVAASESSGNAGSRLVGAATAAFAATAAIQGRSRQRSVLLPSLSQGTKAGALGVSKKAALRRKEHLDSYLSYLLSAGNLLGRSSEILLFLGALFPLSPDVSIGSTVMGDNDILGRTEMSRKALKYDDPCSVLPPGLSRTGLNATMELEGDSDDNILDDDIENDIFRKNGRNEDMIPSVQAKIDKIKLPVVRNRIFELLRHQFGFDNASFARNRLLTALKTASIAVTSAGEFRNTLYKAHMDYLNAESIAEWIDFLTDTLWPNGVFFVSQPPLTAEQLSDQGKEAKELLHASFPDQLRAILGQELTQDGMDIFFEMLQNRMVVKSMAYMLFDLLWLEIFPEIGDVLQGGAALDKDT